MKANRLAAVMAVAAAGFAGPALAHRGDPGISTQELMKPAVPVDVGEQRVDLCKASNFGAAFYAARNAAQQEIRDSIQKGLAENPEAERRKVEQHFEQYLEKDWVRVASQKPPEEMTFEDKAEVVALLAGFFNFKSEIQQSIPDMKRLDVGMVESHCRQHTVPFGQHL
jgi:hypothetical protein